MANRVVIFETFLYCLLSLLVNIVNACEILGVPSFSKIACRACSRKGMGAIFKKGQRSVEKGQKFENLDNNVQNLKIF